MKKTKVLVPALAVLALGMAASVTGTVAWFTQNRSVYAQSLQVAVAANQDLRISDTLSTGTPSWQTSLTWNTPANHVDANMVPATPIAGTVASTTALLASADDATITADPTFVKPSSGNTVDADDGSVGTALVVGDNSAKWEAAGNHGVMTEDFSIKYEGSTGQGVLTANVYGKVTITTGAGKEIDLALRIGMYNITAGTFKVYTIGNATATSYVVNLDTIQYTSPTPNDWRAFIWYEGSDAHCTNANAVYNNLTVRFDYSLDAFN